MEIHALFVLKKTGEAQYYRIFSKQFKDLEVYLISALFSAFFSFTKEVLSEDLQEAVEKYLSNINCLSVGNVIDDVNFALALIKEKLPLLLEKECNEREEEMNEIFCLDCGCKLIQNNKVHYTKYGNRVNYFFYVCPICGTEYKQEEI